ncbi:hypothetical protein BLA18109_06895 [Burkholderia lata]|uniref:Uncharacterized protein n=1 Tax=Burkholderia lata (strain ATCC 17760 / DSM 23089 / LMG 22485 / NCIMB 9086 / R18194 / 383) TaxID=482957 RepID=A0A6P2ZUH4_BURL3|nr:hypothetical protein BLA18109_06895 [Burkholderia lata]
MTNGCIRLAYDHPRKMQTAPPAGEIAARRGGANDFPVRSTAGVARIDVD